MNRTGKAGGYILIVEGGVPTKKGYGMIGGKEMLDVLKEMAAPCRCRNCHWQLCHGRWCTSCKTESFPNYWHRCGIGKARNQEASYKSRPLRTES